MNAVIRYAKERNEALFSMDKEKIMDFFKKYGLDAPENETVFWATVHKCICNIPTAPAELSERSGRWLAEHGMSVNMFTA